MRTASLGMHSPGYEPKKKRFAEGMLLHEKAEPKLLPRISKARER
jgi:hypothetical protein